MQNLASFCSRVDVNGTDGYILDVCLRRMAFKSVLSGAVTIVLNGEQTFFITPVVIPMRFVAVQFPAIQVVVDVDSCTEKCALRLNIDDGNRVAIPSQLIPPPEISASLGGESKYLCSALCTWERVSIFCQLFRYFWQKCVAWSQAQSNYSIYVYYSQFIFSLAKAPRQDLTAFISIWHTHTLVRWRILMVNKPCWCGHPELITSMPSLVTTWL